MLEGLSEPPLIAPAPASAAERQEHSVRTQSTAQALSDAREALLWPSILFALATTSIAVGIMWDISWHVTIGRDTFWTPAHMAIQLGGILSGLTSAWLVWRCTFSARAHERCASVSVFGLRAPLGAWVSIWGTVAMLTSAPFDDWWHNAYGLDVRIISPPHTVLGLGMLAVSVGALLVGLSHQNRAGNHVGNWLFVYIGGVFLALGSVFIMELSFPNLQHAGSFYEACAAVYVFRLATLGVAGRMRWPATATAAVSMGLQCLMTWILPLFPAHPKLAPIFNPVTHMVPPAFPVLVIVPAVAIDLILQKQTIAGAVGWRRVLLAVALGAVFAAVFIPVQWYFANFLLSPSAENWFFVGNRIWGYESNPGVWAHRFFRQNPEYGSYDPLNLRAIGFTCVIGVAGAWFGLLWGGWMRKVQR